MVLRHLTSPTRSDNILIIISLLRVEEFQKYIWLSKPFPMEYKRQFSLYSQFHGC